MPVVPKKRITQYFSRRRQLMYYLDKYRFLFKHRREHYDRRMYQEPIYVANYKTPEFRFPGFWPGKFGFPQSQDQRQLQISQSLATSSDSSRAPEGHEGGMFSAWGRK
eukprot:TRINITY_DN109349_c0_g1_i1.p1 TRINITY_DN109349_c0_g1~~TRINITY_DN109349_c0_g1_i1.p1  ORF type:complete len:108 (+),score=17.30 TRINITY_DN109349_c0_g1_i1:58-381(+)